eukprot:CAMPEP_0172446190 /NCGR_PEP_ID=MMETSP1065-20121228/5844_1 /TAXON_ID=265537 /ORGANISM="Amphiprora paludosa, Strain CCMP125" /LENGTH=337 /DNA_ID=CAMNT_0013197247 /DNA_START=1 /DNA_END=1014 /DNA_ORIENTATION=+
MNDLEAPLLKQEEGNSCTSDVELCKPDAEEASSFPQETAVRMNALSFGTGAYAGLIAQLILATTIWDRAMLRKPMGQLVLFSLAWSVLTCILVNCAMVLFVRDMKASFCPTTCEDAWLDLSMRMESWLIAGALASISSWWFVLDMFAVALPLSNYGTVDLVIVATTIFVAFFALTTPRGPGHSRSSSAWVFNSIASFLGFFVGFGSQFLLSYLLFTGKMPIKALSNLLVFALAWSVCTVLITLGGCFSLRLCQPNSGDKDQLKESERVFLRMESFYVLCSLIGICFAWITLDMFLGMTQQMMPSLAMLFISALIFRAILYCFPEDKCLEEMDEEPQE